MRISKPVAPEKDAYHHGDLRRTLLDAARLLAEERGIDGFTLREVARRAGVSHAAPYHHFADKAALVDAMAIETYRQLAEAMRYAATHTRGTGIDRLDALGLAYVEYATHHPAEFRLSIRFDARHFSPIRAKTNKQPVSPVEVAAAEAYQVLLDTIREGQQSGAIHKHQLETLALTCWSSVHGLAFLLLDGVIEPADYGASSLKELTKMMLKTLAQGYVSKGANKRR